ncbi:MAG: Ig-like domain-containing protein, partial [Myxococcota bacterium]
VLPAAGALEVATLVKPSVRFSRPVDAVAAELVRVRDGQGAPVNETVSVDVLLSASGRTLTLAPGMALADSSAYEIRIPADTVGSSGISLAGNQPDGSFVAGFETVDTTPPSAPGPGTVTVGIPVDGVATVDGGPGAAEPGTTVVVENETTGETTAVTANADGSYTVNINAEETDSVSIGYLDAAGNFTALGALPFQDPDGTTVVPLSGGMVMSTDGSGAFVEVPAGAVMPGTRVRIRGAAGQATGTLNPLGGVELTLSMDALAGLNLRLPAPPGLPEGRRVFVMKRVAGGSQLTQVATVTNGVMVNGSDRLIGATDSGVYDFIDCTGECVVGRLLPSTTIPAFAAVRVNESTGVSTTITEGELAFLARPGADYIVQFLNGSGAEVYSFEFPGANFADFDTIFVPGPGASGAFAVDRVIPRSGTLGVDVNVSILASFSAELSGNRGVESCDRLAAGREQNCFCLYEEQTFIDEGDAPCEEGLAFDVGTVNAANERSVRGLRLVPKTLLKFATRYGLDLNGIRSASDAVVSHSDGAFNFETHVPRNGGTLSFASLAPVSREIRDIEEVEPGRVVVTHGELGIGGGLPTVSLVDWSNVNAPEVSGTHTELSPGAPRNIALFENGEFATVFTTVSLTEFSRLALFDSNNFGEGGTVDKKIFIPSNSSTTFDFDF